MTNDNEFSVLDMVQDFADTTGTTEDDIFKRTPAKVDPPAEEISDEKDPTSAFDALAANDDAKWTQPIYRPDQIETGNKPALLESLVDEQAKETSAGQLGEMSLIQQNLEKAKFALGIKHLNIPTIFNSRVIDCAADSDPVKAAVKLDAILRELIEMFPDAVVEWHNDSRPSTNVLGPRDQQVARGATGPQVVVSDTVDENEQDLGATSVVSTDDVTILIDKSNVSELAFTADEIEKIRRSRSVELKIVERKDLNYTIIDDPVTDIDMVLSQYTRKFNDRAVSLPASRYRCTVTGLSYPEIMDTYYTLKLNNNLDGEMRKWTIAYDHIKNPSIGPFADFDDFLQKTSYLDINYILWNIVCASSMTKEIVSLDCKHGECKSSYEWVYSPETLLQIDQIPAFLLDEMKVTGEALTPDEVAKNYNGSMLRLGNAVELPSSRFVLGFGHASAYSYLKEGIFAAKQAATDVEIPSVVDVMEAEIIPIIKYILVPKSDGTGHYKITDYGQIKVLIHSLDEIDFETIGQLTKMMTEPYAMVFAINDTVCPKCKHRSNVSISEIADLLFIISRSLETANVVLKN